MAEMRSVEHAFDYDATSESSLNVTSEYQVRGPIEVPVYQQAIIITMYSIIVCLSVFGNSIVCFIVFSSRKMRTVMNYFIVSLALSDILMAVLCIPLTFIANLIINSWPFGETMCPIVSFLQVVTVFMSSFTLVAISLDRYWAIVHPLRHKMKRRQGFVVISIIWMLSIIIPLPTAIKAKVHRYVNDSSAPIFCEEVWDNVTAQSVYNFIILLFQYFIPLGILIFAYSRIILVLWIKKTPGEAVSDRDKRMALSKKKIIKMLIVVVIIYAICWLPLHAITIAGDVHLTFYNLPGMNIVWTASHWLAMSNCMYNPFIYCWMNARFRNGFLKVIRVATCRFSKARNVIEMQHMHRHTSARFSSVGNRSNKSNFRSNSTTEYTCMHSRYSSGVLRDI